MSTQTTSNGGWRKLGSRNMWKADWSEYDARELRRLDKKKLHGCFEIYYKKVQ